MHNYIFGIVFLMTVGHQAAFAQEKFLGVPSIEYFDSEDYNAHISNHKIGQDERGLIFVGNKTGLLVYDGSQWRLNYFISERGITSIYPDSNGRVYASSRFIGYYFPDAQGNYRFHSLNHLLPADHRVRPILKTIPYKSGYVFVSINNLYFYDGESIEILPTEVLPPRSIHVHNCGDELYMNPDGKGLAVLNSDGWEQVPNGHLLAEANIVGLFENGGNSLLAFTETNGIYIVRETGIIPFSMELGGLLANSKINAVEKLSDGQYAIGTSKNGLFVMDAQGNLVYHLGQSKGLMTSNIQDVFEDADGNIWLARENGLVKIGWGSAQSNLREELNVPGVGYIAIAHGDHYYFGTSTGLYRAQKQWPIEKVEEIKGVPGPIYNLQSIQGDLLVSGVNSSFQLLNGEFVPISTDQGWMHFAFKETLDPNVLIRGSLSGIYRVEKKNGRWLLTDKYEDFEEWTKYLEFDSQGRLWTATSTKGIYRFEFSEDYRSVVNRTHYDLGEYGLPKSFSRIFKPADQVLFPSINGVFVFNEEEERFEPSADWVEAFEDENDNSKNDVYEIVSDGTGNVFYSSARSNGRLTKNIRGKFVREAYLIDGFQHHWEGSLSVLDESNVLYSQSKGFIHFNREAYQESSSSPKLLIRYVGLTKSDSLLFGGNFMEGEKVVTQQPKSQIPTLDFGNNSIYIGYSSIKYNQHKEVYRYRMLGLEEDWSQWTDKTEKGYPYLPEGDYTFQVQTKNADEELSSIESYSFKILPPWYRSGIAKGMYGLIGLGVFMLIILWIRRRYKKQIGDLKQENIETEIQHKKKQLATTTMHLVEKTEFINSVKTKLGEVIDSKGEKDVLLGIKRVIKSIERNAADDDQWENFEIHFDEVHHGFLKRLRSDFPKITPQEIKLSAYLRMNMSTKEMANLLQVSVRGVEMARFRLRKRLNLQKEDNLVSFMMNF